MDRSVKVHYFSLLLPSEPSDCIRRGSDCVPIMTFNRDDIQQAIESVVQIFVQEDHYRA